MNRLLVFFILSLAVCITSVKAQNAPSPVRPRFSIGAEIAFPTGAFGNLFSVGLGGSGKLEVPITESLYASAAGGFISFYAKNRLNGVKINRDNKSYVPLKAGAKYYLGRSFYAEGEVGASVGIQEGSGVAFAWAPGFGFVFPITGKSGIDAGVRYERWNKSGGNLNQTGIHVAYQF